MMECQDIKQLLAFLDRKSEELDAPERAAVEQHLEKCAECAELAQAEQGFDQAVGPAMREVAIPANLKQSLMKRLAAERRPLWKDAGKLAAAAAVVLLVIGSAAWFHFAPTKVRQDDLDRVSVNVLQHWDEDAATQVFEEQGLKVPLPDMFDYKQYLIFAEVIEFKGRKVAKLSFRSRECSATVLILPDQQFQTSGLTPDPTSVQIIRDDVKKVAYLIRFHGNLNSLKIPLNGA